jgi:hypothetical protein
MEHLPEGSGVLAHLPSELHYLIEPVLRYACANEMEIFSFLDRMGEEEKAELGRIADRVLKNNDYPKVLRFLAKNEITDHVESAKLYFFFGLLDYSGLKFDKAP